MEAQGVEDDARSQGEEKEVSGMERCQTVRVQLYDQTTLLTLLRNPITGSQQLNDRRLP